MSGVFGGTAQRWLGLEHSELWERQSLLSLWVHGSRRWRWRSWKSGTPWRPACLVVLTPPLQFWSGKVANYTSPGPPMLEWALGSWELKTTASKPQLSMSRQSQTSSFRTQRKGFRLLALSATGIHSLPSPEEARCLVSIPLLISK